jgi:arylsulfatase A-like enzyme
LHVPLIIVPPQGTDEPGPRRVSDIVSTVDLFPTILSIAGVAAPKNQGRNLLEWIRNGHEVPLRDEIYAQIGDYHGFIKTSWPSGMPEAGRHASLTHAIRTTTKAYILDPDNGDEAYDLETDPNELVCLTKHGHPALDPEYLHMKDRLEQFKEECDALRKELNVIPGDRGFVEGWE